jgi:hypothetical protein
MRIETRYASATVSTKLVSDPRTYMSDTDVLGAYGLAAKAVPLSVALARLLAGDNRMTHEVISLLSEDVWKRSRSLNIKCDRVTADDLSRACLAWWRDGICHACGGLGKLVIRGTKTLSDSDCKACAGTGKIKFEKNFPAHLRELAAWAQAHIERNAGAAGNIAMTKIAPRDEI